MEAEGLGDDEGDGDGFVDDGVELGVVGVEVFGTTIVPELMDAMVEGDAEGDIDIEAESEGSAMLEAPELLPDGRACDVMVDTAAAVDFGDPPPEIM